MALPSRLQLRTLRAASKQASDRATTASSTNATTGRPKAEELLEGVLLHAAREYEEQRIPYLGRLYGAVAFSADVTPAQANHLLRVFEQLTYRQLVMLAMYGQPSDERRELGRLVQPTMPLGLYAMGEAVPELEELHRTGFLSRPVRGTTRGDTGMLAEVSFIQVELTRSGQLLWSMTDLAKVPAQHVRQVFVDLHPRPDTPPPRIRFSFPNDPE